MFWIQSVPYLMALWFTIIVPGLFTLKLLRVPNEHIFTRYSPAFLLGTTQLGLLSYLSGYAGIRWFTPLVVFPIAILHTTWLFRSQAIQNDLRAIQSIRSHWLSFGIGIGAILVYILPMIGSGWLTPEGIRLYFLNAYDGVMHMALIHSLITPKDPLRSRLLLPLYAPPFLVASCSSRQMLVLEDSILPLLSGPSCSWQRIIWIGMIGGYASKYMRKQKAGKA